MSRTVCVTVDVDVNLEDFDTDDLLEELESRHIGVPVGNVEDVTEMFYAFKLGQTDRAMELAKKIAQDHTGRIL
jgi:threonine synthase